MANPNLKAKYTAEIAPALMQKFGYKSTMQIPRIEKVVVNCGCGEARDNSKVLESVVNDLVVVLSGKDKGKQGKVLEVMPKEGKVIVEKVNMVSRHTKPRKQGDQGGILQKEAPLYACKVQRVCPKCNKPTRPAHKLLADGKKVCVCKKCGAEI